MATSIFSNRITLTFILLVTATALSWAMGHGLGFSDQRYANTFIIIVAFIKIQYVFLEFMEVRHAPRWLSGLSTGWVILVCAGLVYLYWLGTDPSIYWPKIQGLWWPK